MKTIEIQQKVQVYQMEELPEYALNLMKEAEKMLDIAYAPYSNFLVGAAALMEDGTLHHGCNQENASYSLCICAERAALFNAGANAPKKIIKSLAVIAKNPAKPLEIPVSPCGACRQVMFEFEEKQDAPIEVFLKGESNEVYRLENCALLLPLNFSGKVL